MASDDTPIFDFDDPAQFARVCGRIKSLENKGCYRVEIEKPRDQASAKQHGYYWAVVLPYLAKGIRDCWGYGDKEFVSEDAHEFAKKAFLTTPIVNRHTGELKGEITRSTRRDLTTVDMTDYIERIRQFAAEYLGVQIPPPDREHRNKLEAKQ